MALKHIKELKRLKLPPSDFAVFGSGPMAVRNLRDAADVDIIVTAKLWNALAGKYPIINNKEIIIGNIEIFKDWKPWFSDVEKLMQEADVIDGVRYVKLERVIEWKKKMNRSKDREDIRLIQKFLSQKTI